jgi:hypothetical protein
VTVEGGTIDRHFEFSPILLDARVVSAKSSVTDMLYCTCQDIQEEIAVPSNWTYTLFESRIPVSAWCA